MRRCLSIRGAFVVLAPLLLTRCGATPEQLRTRAALDLRCQPPAIAVSEVDPGTRIASGCGRRAIYVEVFNNSRHPVWMLNSEVTVEAKSDKTSSR